jgi:branched-chain amino acid transport system substrate-binding protein
MGDTENSPNTDREADTRAISGVDRRSFLTVAGTGALAMTAGCLGDDGDDGGDGGNGGDGGDGGDGGSTGGGGGPDTITIGALYPLPGEFPAGTAMRNTTEILVENLNSNGGLLGADVEVVSKDTELDPSATRDRYRELILQEEADVTIGTYAAEAATPVFDEIAEFETIHATGGGAQMNIPEAIRNNYEDKKYWFSTINGFMLGLPVAGFIEERFQDLGLTDIAIVAEDIEGFDPTLNALKENMPDFVDIVYETRFASDTTDFTPILDRGEEEDIDNMLALVSQGGSALMTQWAQREMDYHFGGGEVFSSNPARWDATDGLVEYVWTYIGGSGPGFEATEVTEQLISDHRDMFDGSPPPHAQGYTQYDALLSWVRAVEEAGTLDEEEVIPTMEEQVLDGSVGTLSYHGTDGRWPHDPEWGLDRYYFPIIQWQEGDDGGGQQVGLHPDSSRYGEYQVPDWLQ